MQREADVRSVKLVRNQRTDALEWSDESFRVGSRFSICQTDLMWLFVILLFFGVSFSDQCTT
jgi:hypothetical protein